jgi:hypothetical protein
MTKEEILEQSTEELRKGLAVAATNPDKNMNWVIDLEEGPEFPDGADAVVAVFLQKTPKKKEAELKHG